MTMSKHKETNPGKPGFTLIELLVVVAIIAILVALLFPAVKQMIRATQKAQATIEAKQIASASRAYHNANGCWPFHLDMQNNDGVLLGHGKCGG